MQQLDYYQRYRDGKRDHYILLEKSFVPFINKEGYKKKYKGKSLVEDQACYKYQYKRRDPEFIPVFKKTKIKEKNSQ